jgi:rod shape-determining protein MreC
VHDSRRTRAVLAVLLIAALVLITVDYRDGSSAPVRGLRQLGGSAFGGAERAVSAVTGPVTRFFDGSGSPGGDSAQVAALQSQLIRLRAELSQEQLSKADYAELSSMLQLAGKGGYRIVTATVIAVGQGYQQSVTLDAGSDDGVKPRETVLNGAGLVGEVTAVSAQTCTVLLASDASSVVGVELAPSGQIGWVTGQGKSKTGSGLLKLQVLDASATLTPGEQLVTSASVRDRPYVPGVPVGQVERVQNKAGALTALALVQPYVNFTALGVVGIVIVPPRRNPGFSVLPPRPQVKPEPTVTVTVTPGASPGAGRSPGAGGSPGPAPSPSAGG